MACCGKNNTVYSDISKQTNLLLCTKPVVLQNYVMLVSVRTYLKNEATHVNSTSSPVNTSEIFSIWNKDKMWRVFP